jgi:hypothetical protein
VVLLKDARTIRQQLHEASHGNWHTHPDQRETMVATGCRPVVFLYGIVCAPVA